MTRAVRVTFTARTDEHADPGILEEDIWQRPEDVMPEIVKSVAADGWLGYLTSYLIIDAPQGRLAINEDLYELILTFCAEGARKVALGGEIRRTVEGYTQPLVMRPLGDDAFEIEVAEEGPTLRLPKAALLDLADCGERAIRFLEMLEPYAEASTGFNEQMLAHITEVRRLVPDPSADGRPEQLP